MLGHEAAWGDVEYLLAYIADAISHHAWLTSAQVLKNPSKKPPKPLPRPGVVHGKNGETMTINVQQREQITSGKSLSFAEMDAAIARQTGVAAPDTAD